MLDALHQSQTLAVSTAILFGLLIGSFLNVVIHRLPRMMELEWEAQAAELRGEDAQPGPRFNLLVPRSRCPSCGHTLGLLENIPVVSWLIQRGRCRACGWRIPARYPGVELATGALAGLAIWQFGPGWMGIAAVLLGFALIALSMIDLDTHLLPDSMTLPLLWLGLVFNLHGMFVPLEQAVVGAIAGYLALWSVYWLFKLVTGKEGMGYGDFKLLAALGAWFGWTALPAIILLASAAGSVVGISMVLFFRHQRGEPIPFGPYLALGGLLALYFREPLSGLFNLA
jgi:leader peptidase (prepilin peptidase) / N-methyltransferase